MKYSLLRSSALLLAITLTACAVGPDYKRPAMPIPVAFKETPQLPALPKTFIGPVKPPAEISKQLTKATPKDDADRGKWWLVFNDADLNMLEEQVNISNQNILFAEANFRQSRALVAQARSAYLPTLGVSGSLTRSGGGSSRSGVGTVTGTGATTNTNTNTAIATTSTGKSTINDYDASLDASWVPDLWGRVRREVESSKATAQASAADLALARLSAQADLAVDYLDLRVADEQKRVLNNSTKAYARSLEITQNQYKTGIAANGDVLQAKVQLETTQAQAVDVGVQRAQFEHAIALLLGKAPADFSIAEVNNVPALPEIPVSVPAQLLERRPDIAGAERRVAAANAQIGIAEAAFFPDLTLSASGGYTSSELSKLFTMPSRFWSVGPSLVETLFDAGLRAAQTEAAIAAYDATVATYRQTVLTAFQGVEDNLAGLRIYAQEAQVLDGAVKDSQKEVTILTNEYKAGTVSYLNVVTAQTSELNSEITALNVRKSQLASAATLIEDLGGGWDTSALKKPEVTQGQAGLFSIFPPLVKQQ